MGSNTMFRGTLKFAPNTPEVAKKLETFMGEDVMDHPEWMSACPPQAPGLTYIDLVVIGDVIAWDDGAEKTTDLAEKINLIVHVMRRDICAEFGIIGGKLEVYPEYASWNELSVIVPDGTGFVKELGVELTVKGQLDLESLKSQWSKYVLGSEDKLTLEEVAYRRKLRETITEMYEQIKETL